MKLRQFFPVFLAILFLLSCQQQKELTPIPLSLEVKFPVALAPGGKHYKQLRERAECLELEVTTKGGTHLKNSFPPDHWDVIELSQFDFPVDDQDVLSLQVRVWDRVQGGYRRKTPLLIGEKKVRGVKLPMDGEIHMKLKLEIPIEGWD